MYLILELIEKSTDFLKSKGVESPRLNAELLLAEILKCNRMELYLKYDKPLKENEISKYRNFISRRGKREPLQYIVGKVEFYGLNFLVNPDVLIPRQETEILIDTIISNVNKKEQVNILDVGTGSGNIAITLSRNLPNAHIFSIDKSKEALEAAKKNAEINNLSNKIIFDYADIINYKTENNEKFDIIVSNPPYISLYDYSNLEKELLEFEPKYALTDNADGFSFYKIIVNRSEKLLKKNGKIFFEVGKDQSENVEKIMKENSFTNIKIEKDYSEIDRVLWGIFK